MRQLPRLSRLPIPRRKDVSKLDSSRVVGMLTVAAIALLTSACAQEPAAPPEPPKGERVENAQLGVAVVELPAFFKVGSNQGNVIELLPADPQVEGVLTIRETEAESGGINLVAAIERHKEELATRPDGVFKGQRELGSQMGTAFYSRGLFTDDGRTMEEVIVFMVHPKGDRELQMVYLYPSGDDSKERLMDQLFGVLEELEALPMADEAVPEAASAEG